MDQVLLRSKAERVAARVDADAVGFDPLTIVTIITQVLPLIVGCFSRNDEPDPAAVNARVRAMNESNHEALLRRTARRIRGEADHPMERYQSFKLARAVIDEACESDGEDVAQFVTACMNPGA